MFCLHNLDLLMDNIIPFFIPISHTKVANWKEKKNKLIENLKDLKKIDDKSEFINTDFYDFIGDKIDAQNIFKEEIEKFCNSIGAKDYNVNKSWIEDQDKNMIHTAHNHGALGYSSVCYVNYDKEVHRPLKFVSPFNNWKNGTHMDWTPEDDNIIIEESSIIFFPSLLLHYTFPNTSNKKRTVASFNFEII